MRSFGSAATIASASVLALAGCSFIDDWDSFEVRAADAGEAGIDAGARDGGEPPDAGTATDDAGAEVDAGRVRDTACDADAGAVACNGFEDTVLPPPWTAATEPSGAVERETSVVYRGLGAARARTGLASPARLQVVPFTGSTHGRRLGVRAYLFVPSTFTLDESLPVLALSSSTGVRVTVQIQADAQISLRVDAVPMTSSANFAFVLNRWTCVQLEVLVSSTTDGSARLLVDGTQHHLFEGIQTSETEGLPRVQAGVVYGLATGTGPFEVLIDDVIVTEDGPAAPCD